MKICFVTSSFPRYEGDMAATWLLKASQIIQEKGHSISIFAPAYKGLRQNFCAKIKIYRFRYSLKKYETLTHRESSAGELNNLIYKINVLFYVMLGSINAIFYFMRNHFDTINIHWPIPNAIFGIVGKLFTNAKLVYYFHGYELLIIKQYPSLKWLFDFLMKFADSIITNSSYTKGVVETKLNCPIKADIIPMGATIQQTNITTITHDKGDSARLLFVGQLVEMKGLLFLLEAIKILIKNNKKILLTVVGSGDQEEKIKDFIYKNNLMKYVVLKGKLPSSSSDLADEYMKSDIVIVPSFTDSNGNTEALGCVVIEALMFKKPVIASNVGGIPDIIKDNKTGFLVPQKDSNALAKKIIFIDEHYNYALKIAESGYDYVKENFSWDIIVSNLIKAYQK